MASRISNRGHDLIGSSRQCLVVDLLLRVSEMNRHATIAC